MSAFGKGYCSPLLASLLVSLINRLVVPQTRLIVIQIVLLLFGSVTGLLYYAASLYRCS